MIFLSVMLSFLISSFTLWVLLSPGLRQFGLDYPNHRSMHTSPIPRTGGLSVLLGVATTFPFLSGEERYFLILMLVLAVVSFLDDLYNLKISLRIFIHIMVAIIFMLSLEHDLGVVMAIVVGIYLVWHTNLYNFMDGIDGLAGAMACVGFGTLGGMALNHESYSLAVLSLSLAAAVIPFLIFNFSPAKIFMGDSGSVSLGFLSGAIGIYGWLQGIWSLFFPIVLFLPFLSDATFTILKRLAQKKNIFLPHKEHYYQKMIRHGFSVKRVWLGFFLVMLSCAYLAVIIESLTLLVQMMIILPLFVVFIFIAIFLDKVFSRSEIRST